MKKNYPRNMIGYGKKLPKVVWPDNAKLALQIVLNYEEGAEKSTLHNDLTSETFLSEIIGAQPIKGRHINMESLYEYGSRRGFWRVNELFKEKKIPVTIFGVAMALVRNKEVSEEITKSNYSQVYIEIDNANNLQKLFDKIKEEGDSKIKITITEQKRNYLFELKNKRKFNYETLKTLNNEHYIKKIRV